MTLILKYLSQNNQEHCIFPRVLDWCLICISVHCFENWIMLITENNHSDNKINIHFINFRRSKCTMKKLVTIQKVCAFECNFVQVQNFVFEMYSIETRR